MKKLIVPIAILFLAFGFNSCEKYVIPPSGEVYTTYSASVQPFFDNNCISCHESRDPVLTADESYNALKNGGYINTSDPESSLLYQKLLGSHAARTTTGYNKIILDWIKDGAPDN